MTDSVDDTTRVWLVERIYSDDEQNLIILTYATVDGELYFRKERALTPSAIPVTRPLPSMLTLTTLVQLMTLTSKTTMPPKLNEWQTPTTPTM